MKNKSGCNKTNTLNVCICTDHSFTERNSGGVDRIKNLAISSSKHGVKVFVIDRSLRKSIKAILIDNDRYYEFRNGIQKKHSFPLYIIFLFPGLIKLTQEALSKSFSLFAKIKPSEAIVARTIDPYLIVKLFFVCKKEHVDLIQCDFPITTAFSSFLVKRILKIPLIYDAHNVESQRVAEGLKVSGMHVSIVTKFEMAICNLCDSLFVVSENDKMQLLRWNIPESKIQVIPNCVNTNKFSPSISGTAIRRNLKVNDCVVLFFHGALEYPPNREAIGILTRILPILHEKNPSLRLVLVGSTSLKIFNPNIIVAGYVNNLPEYIASADIAVVPILRGGGTRIKILEYMACGKAVVSTFKGAEGLSLKNGEDILMTKWADSTFIALILQLAENINLKNKIGQNARKKVVMLYDWDKNAKKVVQIYRDLCEHQTS